MRAKQTKKDKNYMYSSFKDVGDFMLRDNIVTRMFKLGLDFMRQ